MNNSREKKGLLNSAARDILTIHCLYKKERHKTNGIQQIMKNCSKNLKIMDQNGQKFPNFLKESIFVLYCRAQNSVKNKFYCCIRKFIRKVNKIILLKKKAYKKISQKSLSRIIEAN